MDDNNIIFWSSSNKEDFDDEFIVVNFSDEVVLEFYAKDYERHYVLCLDKE